MTTESTLPNDASTSHSMRVTLPWDSHGERLSQVSAAPASLIQRGNTPHFTVSYETGLAAGPLIADAVLRVCEADFYILSGYFRSTAPGNLPFHINIINGTNGGGHDTCAATTLSIQAQSATEADLMPFMLQLVIAEEDEVFQAAFGRGWDCRKSHGEGLSRVLADNLYPGAEPTRPYNFVFAPIWLDRSDASHSNREDFVNTTDPTDRDAYSTGCAALFLNWLHHHLHFNWPEIVQAGGTTLAEVYEHLTGRTDAWTRFTTVIENHFPQGTPSGVTTDNPFPLFDHLNLFAVGSDGGVYSAEWDVSTGWTDWNQVGTGQFPPLTQVTPLARIADHLDLFATASDTGVYHTFWDMTNLAWDDWNRIGTGGFPQQSVITALSRETGQLDLFTVGSDGVVYTIGWDQRRGWTEWRPRAKTISVPAGASVSAVSRHPYRDDLFVASSDGFVYTAPGSSDDIPPWTRIGDLSVSPGAPIAAVSINPHRLRLFVVGVDGLVYHTYWDASTNVWADWGPLVQEGGNFPQGTKLSVVYRYPDSLDLFAVGFDGGIYMTSRKSSWTNWTPIKGLNVPPGSTVSAISRNPNHLDLFVVGTDSRVYHTLWDAVTHPTWDNWNQVGTGEFPQGTVVTAIAR